MDQFQNNGVWWLPSTSEKVSGKVSFSPTEGVTLELNGTLPVEGTKEEGLLRRELSKECPLIYGDLGRDGPVTIQNATVTSTSTSLGGHNESEEYLAERILIGGYLPQNPSFVRADFFVDEIPVWTNSSNVRSIFDIEDIEQTVDFDDIESVYAATGTKEYTAELEEAEVKLLNYSRISSDTKSVEMETVGVLRVTPNDEAMLNTLFEFGIITLEYLSFATGSGTSPDKIQLYTESNEQPLDVYSPLLDYSENISSSKVEYLFRPSYAEFEATLRNWIEHLEQTSEVHQNYRLLIHSSNLSPRLRFLTTVIALEAYYDSKYPSETLVPEEDFEEIQSDILEVVPDDSDIQSQLYGLLEYVANYPSIKDKLTKLMQIEQDIIEIFFDISELASKTRRMRNDVAHGSIEASPTEFHMMSKKLQLVLEALLAREIGVPVENLPNALANRHQELMDHLDIGDGQEKQ